MDFKRVVWHAAFRILLKTIAEYSQIGCWNRCGDDILRFLFPGVIILSADYEEQ